MDSHTLKAADPRKYVFGFGRRICPGRYLADATIWLAVANILATMDIQTACDPFGQKIVPIPSFKSGMLRHVAFYHCLCRID
ncbi:hypothetical protein IEO21_03470 [Rhodonia placenta]|uniref:Cytochrome P450 n=1 Tax=Rhodonia placenta TaxID=104341 RepID=A0A8H7U3W9_9APHY|nr:hypothetical protein IEO21_03470 [Postia placenta]